MSIALDNHVTLDGDGVMRTVDVFSVVMALDEVNVGMDDLVATALGIDNVGIDDLIVVKH